MLSSSRLGNDCFAEKKFSEAIQHYDEAIRLDPSNASLYSNKSACYASLGQWEEAAREAKACIAKDSNFVKGYGRLATAEAELGRYDHAISTLYSALSKDPGDSMMAILPLPFTDHRRQRFPQDAAQVCSGSEAVLGAPVGHSTPYEEGTTEHHRSAPVEAKDRHLL